MDGRAQAIRELSWQPLQLSSTIVFALDASGSIIELESRGPRLSALEGQVLGRSVFDALASMPWLTRGAASALAGEVVRETGEADGAPFAVEYAPVRDAEGKTTCVRGSGVIFEPHVAEGGLDVGDFVTVIHRLEIYRERWHRRLNAVLELAPLAVGVVRGESLTLERANARLRDLLGGGPIVGSELEPTARRALETGVRVDDDIVVRGRDYSASASPLGLAGLQDDELLVVAVDVSDLAEARRSSARQAAEKSVILENMEEIVIASDAEGNVREANAAALRLHHVSSVDELEPLVKELLRIGKIHRLDGTTLRLEDLPLVRAAQTGEPARDQLIFELTDDTELFIYAAAAPLRKGARTCGALVVGRDVTELMQLDRLKDEFLITAAHELKTPVAIIKAGAQALLMDPRTGHVVREVVARINRGADRIDAVVAALLDVSQLQLGRYVMHPEPIDLRELVTTVIAGVRERRRIELRPGAPAPIWGDRLRLGQVLANLLSNACNYSPPDTPIVVEIRVEGGEARVSVRDEGVGIPRHRQARIFERFYRAHADTPEDRGGIGLGLYLARAFVISHGGRMWFQSVEGGGTTFFFSIPLR